ncbi:MAG TPA: patatin-like phospholipase family protein [Gemmatimonadaceae bacterium]
MPDTPSADDNSTLTTRATRSTRSTRATALVLGGGGARGAYQAGVIRAIGRRHPDIDVPILTGISAGAINATFLAAREANFAAAADELVRLWLSLTPERVYRVDAGTLAGNVLRWAWRLLSGGVGATAEPTRGLVDTTPLFQLLVNAFPTAERHVIAGIDANLARGRLHALALSATSYSTGQSVTWVQGNDVSLWQRPQRRTALAQMTVNHVMASTALPLLFPAVHVGGEWYGDGGIRLTAPLSPALHLGAERIITVSTRHPRSRAEADVSQIAGYPPPAQVLGVLYNAVFLDLIDQDILRLELINQLLRDVPAEHRNGMRRVEILVLRPSRDLGRMAREYEPRLPKAFRFLTRGLGTRETTSPDVLSLVMFQTDYLQALVELGEHDADSQMDRIDAFLDGSGATDGRAAASESVRESSRG